MIVVAMDKSITVDEQQFIFPDALRVQAEEIRRQFSTVATLSCEYGIRYYNKKDTRKESGDEDRSPIEHFGFVDGISNPSFVEKAKPNKSFKNDDKYRTWAPLNLALVNDPSVNPKGEAYGCGSYMVFLKLEQDVKAYDTAIKRFARRLNKMSPDLAEAFILGRFKDGTPVALSSTGGLSPMINNFKYINDQGGEDLEGLRCPLHAHARKVNPRNSYRETRIVRRGLTYGRRVQCDDCRPGWLQFRRDTSVKDVGLLFMCFQRDIGDQYGRIMNIWARENSPRHGIGFDPIIGQINGEVGKQQWRDRWGPNPEATLTKVLFPVRKFITVKGGEYFFAPSIPFLKNITKM
jgi:Dyp-type peroxidase family